MRKFLNPFTDIGFKRLFGQEANKDLLIECKTDLERWIYILSNMDITGITPYDTQQRKIFKKLLNVADIDKMSRKERLQYEANLKSFRDYHNTIDYAVKVSREEGKIEGKAETIKIVALRLKESGVSLDLIIQTTGLSPEEIERL